MLFILLAFLSLSGSALYCAELGIEASANKYQIYSANQPMRTVIKDFKNAIAGFVALKGNEDLYPAIGTITGEDSDQWEGMATRLFDMVHGSSYKAHVVVFYPIPSLVTYYPPQLRNIQQQKAHDVIDAIMESSVKKAVDYPVVVKVPYAATHVEVNDLEIVSDTSKLQWQSGSQGWNIINLK